MKYCAKTLVAENTTHPYSMPCQQVFIITFCF